MDRLLTSELGLILLMTIEYILQTQDLFATTSYAFLRRKKLTLGKKQF